MSVAYTVVIASDALSLAEQGTTDVARRRPRYVVTPPMRRCIMPRMGPARSRVLGSPYQAFR